MTRQDNSNHPEVNVVHGLVLLLFMLAGVLMIVASVVVPVTAFKGVAQPLLREFGVVIFAVSTTSLIYERLIAERHFRKFLDVLQASVRQGESNTASCERLGIERIYLDRREFLRSMSFADLVDSLGEGDALRIAGKSLLATFKNGYEVLCAAISRGVTIDLYMLDPDCPQEELARVDDLEKNELQLSLDLFRRGLAQPLASGHAKGTLALHTHDQATTDSFVEVQESGRCRCIWDISFGKADASKRVLLVDGKRPLGRDLRRRFDRLGGRGAVLFLYKNGQVTEDRKGLVGQKQFDQ